VLVISGFEDRARRIEAFRCGADDFLTKPFFSEEFVWRLRRIMQTDDEVNVAPVLPANGEVTKISADDWQNRNLSRRELEVCERLLQGMSDKQISDDLHIAFWTVRTHVRNVFIKLGLINRRELMSRYRPREQQ
jgi:two-component system response regulator FixJ